MTKKHPTDKEKQDISGRIMDNPDLLNTEKESIFDTDEDMKTVDPIPVEELNEKVKDEKINEILNQHRRVKTVFLDNYS